jgi:hypothetical protein
MEERNLELTDVMTDKLMHGDGWAYWKGRCPERTPESGGRGQFRLDRNRGDDSLPIRYVSVHLVSGWERWLGPERGCIGACHDQRDMQNVRDRKGGIWGCRVHTQWSIHSYGA